MPTNEYEHLQDVIRRIHNKIVREDFRDDIEDDDISYPEASLRTACLIKDNDTADMMQLRTILFYTMREFSKRQQPAFYAYPVDDYQASVKFKPQLIFWFWETKQDAKERNRPPKRVRASFRLVNETSESLTLAEVDRLKSRIKTQFPRSYRFKTGRFKASYKDKNNGLELILSPYSEPEAKEMVGKILNVANVSPDWDKLSISQYPDKNFSEIEYVSILGERKKLPDKRPIANVYLKLAQLHIHGSTESITLYDTYVG